MLSRFVEFDKPYRKLNPNSRNAAEIPPKIKYFNAASADRALRLLNATRI